MPCASGELDLVSQGGHTTGGQESGLPGVYVQAFSCVTPSWARQFTSPCLLSHSFKMGLVVLGLVVSGWICELSKQFFKVAREKEYLFLGGAQEIER